MLIIINVKNLHNDKDRTLSADIKFEKHFKLYLDNHHLMGGSIQNFMSFVRASIESPKSEWFPKLQKNPAYIAGKNWDFNDSVQLMLFRSLCVISISIGIEYARSEEEIDLSVLEDEFWIDWTGKLGTQPSIYFIPIKLYDNARELNELYNTKLLYRIIIKFENQGDQRRFFVPFNVPRETHKEYLNKSPIWREILQCRERKMIQHGLMREPQ